ncbi:hypothetical protein F5148DRAFT_1149774 [Russula earlei]|uniref:Uncharacterized protein n=1 Tax=Russula earlei TaxID=71964 RepID=A0ACC0U716_9AGAM|nr:hypothetical protein F5148DRAFT_1149774 [Russula earlei]
MNSFQHFKIQLSAHSFINEFERITEPPVERTKDERCPRLCLFATSHALPASAVNPAALIVAVKLGAATRILAVPPVGGQYRARLCKRWAYAAKLEESANAGVLSTTGQRMAKTDGARICCYEWGRGFKMKVMRAVEQARRRSILNSRPSQGMAGQCRSIEARARGWPGVERAVVVLEAGRRETSNVQRHSLEFGRSNASISHSSRFRTEQPPLANSTYVHRMEDPTVASLQGATSSPAERLRLRRTWDDKTKEAVGRRQPTRWGRTLKTDGVENDEYVGITKWDGGRRNVILLLGSGKEWWTSQRQTAARDGEDVEAGPAETAAMTDEAGSGVTVLVAEAAEEAAAATGMRASGTAAAIPGSRATTGGTEARGASDDGRDERGGGSEIDGGDMMDRDDDGDRGG